MSEESISDRNTIVERFHGAVRALYLALDYDAKDFDARDLSSFGQDSVPDAPPLFGGRLYCALPCIYDEVYILDEIAAQLSAETSFSYTGERGRYLTELGAFYSCKQHAIALIYEPLWVVLSDLFELVLFQDKEDYSSIRQLFLNNYSPTLEALLLSVRTELCPQYIEMVRGFRSLYPDCSVHDAAVFAESVMSVRATLHLFRSSTEEFVSLKLCSARELRLALEKLVIIHYLLMKLAIDVEYASRVWQYILMRKICG